MPDPSAVNTNAQTSNVAKPSASGDGKGFAGSPLTIQNQETPNFSRPLPLSPPGSLRSIALPKNTVADTAQAVKSSTSSLRPLPSVPSLVHGYSSGSLENIEGGRGSGLGTRIIDDRDPDDLVVPSPPFFPSQSPRRSYEEDGQISTAGASDSELLYASAPSTPMRVSNDLEVEEIERGGATVKLSAHGVGRHEPPERRVTVALGEPRHDRGQGPTTPKRAATVDYYGRGDQEPRIPAPDTQVQEPSQTPQHEPDDHTEEDLEYADDLDPYLRRIVKRFGEDPLSPEPLVRGYLATAPAFPQPLHQSQPVVLGLPDPESYDLSPSQHGKATETVSPPMPSAISFPIPAQERERTTWKPDPPFILHDEQTSGGQFISSNTSQFPLPVIAGTNIQFEPLPPLQRTASGVSRSTHGEGVDHPHTLTGPPTLSTTGSQPGAFPGELPPPPSWARQEHSSPPDAGIFQGDSGDLSIPPKETTPIAPLRILKHPHTPPYSPGIPPGAAVPTPPGSSSPGSPNRIGQSSDTKPPVPGASVPSLPTPQAQKFTSLGPNTAIMTPQNPENPDFVPVEANAGVAKQVSLPARIAYQTQTSLMHGEAKLDAGPLTSSLDASGPVKPVLVGGMRPDWRPQESTIGGSEPARATDVRKGNEVPLKPRENGSTGLRNQTSEAGIRSHPGEDQVQGQPSQRQLQSGPQSQPQSQSRSQQTSTTQQSHPQPFSVPEPQRRPPQSDADATPSASPTRGRHSHRDSVSSQQPRTLAEEKAHYNAVPPASRSAYMNMLLALDDIPMIYNLLASFFTWILLAGFVLFPGTFSTLQTVDLGNGVGAALVHKIVNLPLFIVAFICTGIGIIGMGYLWWRWMKNYIWLVNKIFLPGLMNSLAGVLSTLVNVYGVQHGVFVTTSIATISVTGGVGVVCGLLILWYGVWLLGRVKRRHMTEVGVEKAGKHGEGVWAGFKAKIKK